MGTLETESVKMTEEADELDGLSEAHLISKDAAVHVAEALEKTVDPIDLIISGNKALLGFEIVKSRLGEFQFDLVVKWPILGKSSIDVDNMLCVVLNEVTGGRGTDIHFPIIHSAKGGGELIEIVFITVPNLHLANNVKRAVILRGENMLLSNIKRKWPFPLDSLKRTKQPLKFGISSRISNGIHWAAAL